MKNYSNEIAALEVQIVDVKRSRFLLDEALDLKVAGILNDFFNPFRQMEIKVSGTTATFHLKDEGDYIKEIFSLYFYSRYQMDPVLQLSYYSTSTNSEFELDRLILIGKTARVIKERSQNILSQIKEVRDSSKELLNELFGIQLGYENQVSKYREEEFANKKVAIRNSLLAEGIVFSSSREIQLKFNQVSYLKEIRVEGISASGKTCKVVYKDTWGDTRTERNVNVEKVINQVTSLHTFIAELEIA